MDSAIVVHSKKGRGRFPRPQERSGNGGDLDVDGNDFLRIVVTAREANVVRALKLAAVWALCVVAEGDCVV